ncbi:MAG: hypothetical protein WD335_02015 [Candidatus Paceibacterota bacterium]
MELLLALIAIGVIGTLLSLFYGDNLIVFLLLIITTAVSMAIYSVYGLGGLESYLGIALYFGSFIWAIGAFGLYVWQVRRGNAEEEKEVEETPKFY